MEERERNEIAVETEQAQRESAEAAEGNKRDRFKGTVWGKDVRKRTILGIFLMAAQQVTVLLFGSDLTFLTVLFRHAVLMACFMYVSLFVLFL